MAASSTPGNRGQLQFSALEEPDMGADETALSDQCAAVGTRRVGTTAERNALSGAKLFDGLLWGDTTDKNEYKRVSGAWKRQNPATGIAQFTTDASGLGYVSHGLGFVPSSVGFTQGQMDDTIGPLWKATIGALTASQIQVVSYRTDSNTRLATTIVSLHWVAYP